MNETDLHDVMERATNAIESRRELTAAALRGARRRRTGRRTVVAVCGSVVLVVTIALVSNVSEKESKKPSPVTPPVGEVVKARWDPRDVDDLPRAAEGIAPAIPDWINSPDASPLLTDSPIEAAVLAVAMDSTAQVRSTDGTWRSVPLPGRYPGVALSPEGTRLVVVDDVDAGEVYDLRSGEHWPVAPPAGSVGWDYSSWTWVDERTLLFTDAEGGWLVDSDTSEARRVPFPRLTLSWAIDPDGHVVESADWTEPSVLTDWAGGQARRVSMSATGRLSSIQADADAVVGTSYEKAPFAVVLADRSTLTPQAVLRTRDHEANYSNGGLSVLALLDDGSVLLRVAVFGQEHGFRIVCWQPDTGDLSVVSSSTQPLPANVVFARGLIRKSDP